MFCIFVYQIKKKKLYNLKSIIMKLKIAYTITYSLIIISGICAYLFFALNSDGDPIGSNYAFIIGFLSICISFILLPTKPLAIANPKGFRVKYWNYLNK